MAISSMLREQLLSDRRVIDEIERHKWLESERLGHDIGFEKAKEEWLKTFSKAWMKFNLNQTTRSAGSKVSSTSRKSKDSCGTRRCAKSYLK